MTTAPAGADSRSDAELITAVRGGSTADYGALYERHVGAAYNLARQLARSSAEADDLVAEAFAKVLDTLRQGKGPDSAFRAYLLTALRHTAYDKTRKDKRVDLNEDMSEVTGALGGALTVPFSDTAVAGLEKTLAARAFAKLPERWQAVLWHTEIEQQSPAEVAPILGLTPNGVSALAYRAREGLRQAYLQVHLSETAEDRCRAAADKLGAWTRDGLSKRERTQVETHLDDCDQCRALAAELADVNGAIRSVIPLLVLGTGATGYLAAAGAVEGSAAGAAAAAGSAAASGAAAGSSAGASSAGGAAAAGAALPRQLIGVGSSAAAVAVAIAIAMAAGGPSPVPTAQPQQNPPPAASPEQPAPAPNAPAPNNPAPPPPPAQDPPPPAEDQPAQVPPAPQPQDPPAEQPPQAPELEITSVADAIELVPGGKPVNLPIKVRNNGEEKSEPVKVTLSMPRGVHVIDPAGGGNASMSGPASVLSVPSVAARQQHQNVKCPAGEGTVTCSTPEGLDPGATATLTFRLEADEDAEPGEITGTVSGGSGGTLRLSVPVVVEEQKDGVELAAYAHGWHLWVGVRNTGETVKPAVVTVNQPLKFAHPHAHGFECTGDDSSTTCTSKEPLKPDQSRDMQVLLKHWTDQESITVTARIGSASMSKTLSPWCLFACFPRPPEMSNPPEPSTPPAEPSDRPSSGPAEPSGPSGSPSESSTEPGQTSDAPTTGEPEPTSEETTTDETTTTTTESSREHPGKGHGKSDVVTRPQDSRPVALSISDVLAHLLTDGGF